MGWIKKRKDYGGGNANDLKKMGKMLIRIGGMGGERNVVLRKGDLRMACCQGDERSCRGCDEKGEKEEVMWSG